MNAWTRIKCFGLNQHFNGIYTVSDDSWEVELIYEWPSYQPMDDEHLAQKAWAYAQNTLIADSYDDDNCIYTKYLSYITVDSCEKLDHENYPLTFEVDETHQYPMYNGEEWQVEHYGIDDNVERESED